MKRNLFKSFVVAVAAVAGLTACNMNELVDVNRSADLINFTVLNGGMTKAVDVTTANLTAFEVTAFNHSTETSPYINAVSYTGGSGTFASATPYYWPEGNLDFYAWSQGAATGNQVEKTNYKTFVVTPSATPASQVDLIFAGKTNIGKANSTDGAIALNFRHAESKVVVKVKNTAPNLKFVISDWRLGFIDDAGTFTYSGQGVGYDGSTDGNNSAQLAVSMWSGNTDATAAKMYTNSLASNVNIAANASETLLDGEMIVIPQTVTAASAHAAATAGAAVNGSYVGIKLKILNRDNDAVIYSDGASGTAWAIWPADFNFEPGKKYTFTVDLCGGGYYETNHDSNADLDPILEGAVISFASVTVDDFSAQSAVELPVTIATSILLDANDAQNEGSAENPFYTSVFPGPLVCTVVLPSDATGTVTLITEGRPHTMNVGAGGRTTFSVYQSEPGNYNIEISYSGDMKYSGSETAFHSENVGIMGAVYKGEDSWMSTLYNNNETAYLKLIGEEDNGGWRSMSGYFVLSLDNNADIIISVSELDDAYVNIPSEGQYAYGYSLGVLSAGTHHMTISLYKVASLGDIASASPTYQHSFDFNIAAQ